MASSLFAALFTFQSTCQLQANRYQLGVGQLTAPEQAVRDVAKC